MEETFDTDLFISEIQNYPCIWDYKCESYSNKVERNNAWANICQKFTTNFAEKSVKEKNDIAKTLQRKWKTLRDGFNREVKKNKSTKSGSAASNKRPYVFFDQLSFLMPLAEARAETSNSLEDTSSQNNEDEENREPPKDQPRKRKSCHSAEDKLIETLSKRIDKKINDDDGDDDDKYFLLSLHKDLKNVPEDFKLDAKTEIIGVLKKFKAMSSSQFNRTEHVLRNPYIQYTNQPLSYNTNPLHNQPINHHINSYIPTTSGQFQRNSVSTPLSSPQDSLSMDSVRTTSSFEDVFQL